MANNKMIIEERARDLGGFLVGRLLPFRKKRQVGPFTFVDHMGPSKIGQGKYIDVDQHPHIGLSTLTYLFEGQIHHKDSIGADQIISPGDVGFMTSGKAVAHTERTPEALRGNTESIIHGYQLWVALPKEMEDSEPNFQYFANEDLPRWKEDTTEYKLIAGSAFGRKSPLKVYSDLFMLDIHTTKPAKIQLGEILPGEIAILVAIGSLVTENERIDSGQMLVAKTQEYCSVETEPGTRILVFGGQPLREERHMYWNFVSSSKEKIDEAKSLWQQKKFPKVPGDDTYIPLP